LVNSAVKTDDELVDESPLALFEEMVEVSLEPLELSSLGNQLSLHLGRHLLIEGELFDDEVVIVEEGLIDVVFDVVVQIGLNMERLVRFLNLLDPHVEGVQLLVDEVLEVVGGVKDRVDATHEEREKDEADKLEGNRENVFLRGFSNIVTVAYSGDDLKNPVEGENILGVVWLLMEV